MSLFRRVSLLSPLTWADNFLLAPKDTIEHSTPYPSFSPTKTPLVFAHHIASLGGYMLSLIC